MRPDVLDLHEEPFSAVTHQVLAVAPAGLTVVCYSAQNIDKRWPPPFDQWQRSALARAGGAYPCSRQAASVLRGRGFAGPISVLPLGVDRQLLRPGPRAVDEQLVLGLVGRLVPEKGVLDAVEVLAQVRAIRPARLVVVGSGPMLVPLRRRAEELGVAAHVEVHEWCAATQLAEHYRRMSVLLVPSRSTRTWTEQFGRVVTEARACGTPVVAFASGALPEVVGDPLALVDEGDVAGMTAAVLTRLGASSDPDRVLDWDAVAEAQLELYRRAMSGREPAPAGRANALAEFGPPARVQGGGRPFALPVLRNDNAATRALARLTDLVGRH